MIGGERAGEDCDGDGGTGERGIGGCDESVEAVTWRSRLCGLSFFVLDDGHTPKRA
jgi:hypothetical protein